MLPIIEDYGNKLGAIRTTKDRSNNGFTLTEVLVALSILLIISVAFLTLLTNSYSDIVISGLKNKALHELQSRIEHSVAEGLPSTDKEVIISFPGVENPIKVTGSIIKEEMTVNKRKISIAVFIPH